jgi:lipopolysaccharide transport system ATP-binding protein
VNVNDSAAVSGPAAAGDKPVVLRAQALGKGYKLYDNPRARLRALLAGRGSHRTHWALAEVSFELRRGQCMGLIGDNGAGKSTLLKLVAGTLQPTTGLVDRIGRITAILELGAGFHPEFSGRDNLYFAGALVGIGEREMKALEASIIEFAELESAIDRPVKTYSSGMVVRLAFALVTAVEPDVLIVDEALAVGDQHFQKKCIERIEAFRRNGCTILFCSHSLYHIRQLCDVALWLDQGRPRAFGPTEQVLARYEAHVRAQDAHGVEQPAELSASVVQGVVPKGRAGIESVEVAGLGPVEGEEPPLLAANDLMLTIRVRGRGEEVPSVGVMIEQLNGVGVTSVATHADKAVPRALGAGAWEVGLCFPNLPLHSGAYVISVYLFDASGMVVYDEWKDCVTFSFVYPSLTPGLVRLPHAWT